MYYVMDITVPINTPESTPVSFTFAPMERTIKEVQIAYLDDPATVGLRILDHSSKQVIPSIQSPNKWIKSALGVITLPADDVALIGSPYEVRVEAYNTSGTVAVDIQLRFVIVNMTLLQAVIGLVGAVNKALLHPIFNPKEGAP